MTLHSVSYYENTMQSYEDILLEDYNQGLSYQVGNMTFTCFDKESASSIYKKENYFVREIAIADCDIQDLEDEAGKNNPYYWTEPCYIEKKADTFFGLFYYDQNNPEHNLRRLKNLHFEALDLVGFSNCVVYKDDPVNCIFNGICITREHQKKGLPPLLHQARANWTINQQDLTKLTTSIYEYNNTSRQSVENLGFSYQGITEERCIWGETRELTGRSVHYQPPIVIV